MVPGLNEVLEFLQGLFGNVWSVVGGVISAILGIFGLS